MQQKLVLVFLLFTSFARSQREDACDIILSELRYPCKCSAEEGPELYDLQLDLNCDNVVFGDFPVLPYGAPVRSFTQRFAGYQSLPMQAFASRAIPLAVLDFSENSLRHLTEHSLDGLRESLRELVLANNLLGDTLNPIFASGELYGLTELRVLDLRGNKLRALEEGFVKGCPQLQELLLDRNALNAVPSASLNGPRALRALTLSHNLIGTVRRDAFWSQPRLELLDLSSNGVAVLEGGALSGLSRLRALRLAKNRLTRLNSDTFKGAENMEVLDLAENFLGEFPTTLNNADVSTHTNLEVLDLSRNALASLAPGTFVGLRKLRRLFLNVNSLRTVEDDAFEGLENLEYLSLEDNTVLLVPTSALGRLPRLSALFLGFNRVAAVNEALLRPAANVQILSLQYNVIRELPINAFSNFSRLVKLDLAGNQLQSASTSTFSGIENVLEELWLQDNRITVLGQLALPALRRLSLASQLSTTLETPFLRTLNISHNELTSVPSTTFHRATLLETIDLANNSLNSLALPSMPNLHNLDASSNPVEVLSPSDLGGAAQLRRLKLCDMSKLTRLEAAAFQPLTNLEDLEAHGFPRLGYLDIKGMLALLPPLQRLDVEVKDASLSDQFSIARHPRMRDLGLRGPRVQQVASSGLLAGMTAPKLTVRLRETALRTLPPSLLLPVPRSTYLTLDVANSELSTLSAPLLAALDSRKNHFKLQGLESNPISCDCNAVQLKQWLIGHPSNVTCAKPDDLRGQSLLDLPDSELICGKRITRPPTTEMTTTTFSSTVTTTSTPELDIIWSVAPTVGKQPEKTTKRPVNKASSGGNSVTNDDTLIIAIVGGVVAFIALLIIIICIARCRMSSASRYRGGPLAAPPMLPLPACTCVKPPPSSSVYMNKMAPQSMAYPPMGGQTYYISYPPEDPEVHMEVQSVRGNHQ
ncbi:hypothetical protein B566_EDAN003063 [Ephemera danica]|nr:hypothetical protein B566_EDAN003063 [Ephemera danica]